MTSCEQELLKDPEAELLTKLKNHQPTDSTFELSLWAFTCGKLLNVTMSLVMNKQVGEYFL